MSSLLNDSDDIFPPRKSKSYDDSEMDITPMIDITFLLLIFFLVASKMDSSADVSLPPAKYGVPVAQKTSVIVTLNADEEGEAIVYLGNGANDDTRVDSSDKEEQEAAVTAYIQDEMANGDKTMVLLKAAKNLKQREVSRIQQAVGKAETTQQLFVAVLETS